MNEMMNYIFGSMDRAEKGIRSISKSLRKQTKFNRNVTLFAAVVTAYIILSELDRRERETEIKKLSKEIEELKGSEGE